MSFLLTCPHCGSRPVGEFAFRGELTPQITDGMGHAELHGAIHRRRNVAGPQREWWMHRAGCHAWFLADRDTTTNTVLATALAGEATPEENR
ncbi:MAG: sarcosine oxidase subunit delta [Solirubrobacteraceae bacterium]